MWPPAGLSTFGPLYSSVSARRALCLHALLIIANTTVTMNSTDLDTASDLNQTTMFTFDTNEVNIYYTPVLVFLGLFGNFMSMYVFYATKLRSQSTSHYLSALAISDSVFIVQLLPPWLNAMEYTGIFHYEVLCQIFVYVSYFSCSLSSWLVVAFTVERYVAVLHPLRRNLLCTVRRARLVIVALAVTAALLNLPLLWFAKPTTNDCNVDVNFMLEAASFNLVDTVVSFTVPLAAIVVLNTWIMVGVYRIEKTRQRLMRSNRRAVSSKMRDPPLSQHRVTRMLLIVSSVFVVFNVPAYTMRIMAYAYDMEQPEYGGAWGVLQQIALMFFNTNFAINFLLYCLSGQNFRHELRQKIPWLRARSERAVAACGTHSIRPARASSISTSCASNVTDAVQQPSFSIEQAGSTPNPRRNQNARQTWKFDNSRQNIQRLQRCQDMLSRAGHFSEQHEMTVFNSGANN